MVYGGVGEKDRVMVGVGEITLSNTLQLTALKEKAILTSEDVIKRMEEIRDMHHPN